MSTKTKQHLLDSMILKLTTNSNTNNFPLSESEIECLCYNVRNFLISQPMLLEIECPVVICGDIHGQYTDLLNIFRTVGQPGNQNYLFLGDYVDRGKQSLECICLLMAYKIKFPQNIFLLRGNHECRELNKVYGFYDECKRKFGPKLWRTVADTFDYLPIAAVIASRIFCVHGGLSPKLTMLSSINNLKRPTDSQDNNIVCDLLWSDPSITLSGWCENIERGISYLFGKDVVIDFLEQYDFDMICRSHQVVEEGYEFFAGRSLVTIFSAPNYCGQFNNAGSVLKVDKELLCTIHTLTQCETKGAFKERNSTPIRKASQRKSTELEYHSDIGKTMYKSRFSLPPCQSEPKQKPSKENLFPFSNLS